MAEKFSFGESLLVYGGSLFVLLGVTEAILQPDVRHISSVIFFGGGQVLAWSYICLSLPVLGYEFASKSLSRR